MNVRIIIYAYVYRDMYIHVYRDAALENQTKTLSLPPEMQPATRASANSNANGLYAYYIRRLKAGPNGTAHIIIIKTQRIMAIGIKLKHYKNCTKSSFGKWYAQTVSLGVIDTEELAKHISRNSTFTEGDVLGVLRQLACEMQRALQNGKTVRLNGIGRFRIVAESEGVENPHDFNIQQHIKNVRMKFLAEGTRNAITWKVTRLLTAGTDVRRLPANCLHAETLEAIGQSDK